MLALNGSWVAPNASAVAISEIFASFTFMAPLCLLLGICVPVSTDDRILDQPRTIFGSGPKTPVVLDDSPKYHVAGGWVFESRRCCSLGSGDDTAVPTVDLSCCASANANRVVAGRIVPPG